VAGVPRRKGSLRGRPPNIAEPKPVTPAQAGVQGMTVAALALDSRLRAGLSGGNQAQAKVSWF